jgi:hypothetical protein
MSKAFALRRDADEVRMQLETTLADVGSHEVGLQNLHRRIEDGTFEGVHGHSPEEWLEIKEGEQAQRQGTIEGMAERLGEITDGLASVLDKGKPLFRQGNSEPIALLPVRLETRFADDSTVQVRVFPDDLHIDAFDPRLTPAELKAARDYWRKPSEPAWQELLGHLSPARAAWATRATRKGAPEPQLREEGERRAPRISTLPSHWRCLGLLGGEAVVDESGKEIPVPLPLGVLMTGEGGANREQAKWLVEFSAAEEAGMAMTLKLPEGVDHLDELLVVGVQRSSGAEASQRLRDTLIGHAFGAGLGFLAPGTPTNNTPQSRSAWSSRPEPRPPGSKRPRLAPQTDAARLARALGLPKAAFLAECPGGGDSTERAVAALTLLSWGALGQGMVDASHGSDLVTGEDLPVDVEAWRAVRDHLIDHVRSRGPLPAIRVGKQPYGVLPVSSLDDWVAQADRDPTASIALWLLRLRHHWRAALAPGWIPRVSDGVAADRTAVDVLSRLPVAVDLVVRRLLSPRAAKEKLGPKSSGPALSIGDIGAGANLRWTVPTELISSLSFTGNATKPDYALVGPRLDPEPGNFTEVLTASRELWADALAVVEDKLSPAEYERRWPLALTTREGEAPPRRDTIFAIVSEGQHPGFVAAMLHPGNWSAWPGADLGEDDLLRQALDLPGTVDNLVTMELDPAAGGDEQLRAEVRAGARKSAKGAPRVIDALAALEATPPAQLLPLAFEVLDVYSHRLDAWITSLASRRLRAMRDSEKATGIRIGGYGWVENLHRDRVVADVDGYVHAPSLHHAATAAVLRSGFRAHQGEETLAVNLTSRRARIARWLLGGVRRGQELGSLLGYRFERALHDNGHDELIDDFRLRYPAPVAAEPQDGAERPDRWQRSTEAIAARNVVDGMALARDAQNASAAFPAAAPMVAELADALDAVSDLLLAESVHHLVGGNAMRAGLSADTLGRGEDVPDRFDVLRTPYRGRAIVHRVAAVLPATPVLAEGWSSDALSALEPRVEAWVADALGPASGRRLTGVLISPDGGERPFDREAGELGFGALTTALEVSAADHARLDRRVIELEGEPGAAVRYEGAGWQELRGAATRVRSLLASAQPLLPAHLAAGPAAAEIVPGLEELRDRLAAFVATLPGRSKPATPAGRLSKLAKETPGPGWLSSVATALADVLGTGVPVVPLLTGAELGPVPDGTSGSELADWIRRTGSVRPSVRIWHELLLLTGANSGQACSLSASQSPLADPAEAWIGGTFPATKRPAARQHLACHLPSPLPAEGLLAGIVFDEWVEVLPGSDALAATKLEGEEPLPAESELTGLSFHFDRPDAKAPQAILVAVPPNAERGWTEDGLALVVHDTLELAKLRAVDLGDLPLLDDVLPGLRLNNQSPLGSLASGYWRELAE